MTRLRTQGLHAAKRCLLEGSQRRRLRGRGVGRCRRYAILLAGDEPAAYEQAVDTAYGGLQQRPHLFVGRGRELGEDDTLSSWIGREDAIDGRGVEVQVEAQASAEALDHRDAPPLPRLDAEPAGAASMKAEQGPHVDLQHRPAELVVIGESIAKRVGQAENPLAHRSTRKDLVDRVGGALRHAAPAATRAEAAALA